jgi:hypothetical protein
MLVADRATVKQIWHGKSILLDRVHSVRAFCSSAVAESLSRETAICGLHGVVCQIALEVGPLLAGEQALQDWILQSTVKDFDLVSY